MSTLKPITTHTLRLRRVGVQRLAIPMRVRFEHAAATRDIADPVIVRLEAEPPFDQHPGYGETLARPYVTGETVETVAADIREHFAPLLLDFRCTSFAEALEFADQLPTYVDGRLVNAARAAVELAVIDLAGKVFQRSAADVAGWLDLPDFGRPGALRTASYSGIVVGRSPRRLSALLRAQRCYGLRDFKIKVAVDGWQDRLERAARLLRRALVAGRATLRTDANYGWTLPEALEAAPLLTRAGVCALEQPLRRSHDDELAELAAASGLDIIADESLLTIEDGQRLLDLGGVQVFNIRIAKNGGLLPALRLAHTALAAGRDVQLGCLVGETSILSAAGIAFLSVCPRVRFVEGAFGPFLLRGDVVARPIRFGYAGRVAPLERFGLGIEVDPQLVRHLQAEPPVNIQF